MDALDDPLRLWWRAARLVEDAQSVAALRMSGLIWLRPASMEEAGRMVAEKAPAFAEAALSAFLAAAMGRSPVRVAQAAIHPLSVRVRANRDRLSARDETAKTLSDGVTER